MSLSSLVFFLLFLGHGQAWRLIIYPLVWNTPVSSIKPWGMEQGIAVPDQISLVSKAVVPHYGRFCGPNPELSGPVCRHPDDAPPAIDNVDQVRCSKTTWATSISELLSIGATY